MRVRVLSAIACAMVLSFSSFAMARPASCTVGVVEGEVKAGESFVRPIGGGLELMLEALRSGWIIRFLPAKGPRPSHDYAELATPPYHSVSPLLITTYYSFRAQDAIGWNVRRFRYATNPASYAGLLQAYDRYEAGAGKDAVSQQSLASLVTQEPAASLTILDARLVPGTADQPRTAATLASHFLSTAHTIEQPPAGKPTPLGTIRWIRFRAELTIPTSMKPARGLQLRYTGCGQL